MPAKGKEIWVKILDALLFIITLVAVGIAFVEGLPEWSNLLVLVLFVFFFFLRWLYSSDRNAYLKSNWLDLALVVLLSSPFLRLLVAFKVAGLAPAMRIGVLIRANKDRLMKLVVVSGESFPAAMALVFGVVFLFGTVTYLLEHGSNPGFAHISDGLWWAFVTLTTVGYGDVVPHSSGGRMVAVMTMVFGITIYSLLIANLTYFVERMGRERADEKAKEAVKTESVDVSVEIDQQEDNESKQP
ncbi:MAG: potassium channel family protein [Mariprofundaceae bacterium]